MESYRRKFPDIIKRVKECNRKKDLEVIYSQMVQTLCAPWSAGKPVPQRYSSFWSGKLDHLSKLRKKFYKKAMSLNTEYAWERYRKCKSEIRIEVNRRKRAEYQDYIRNIEEKDNAKAIEQIR